MLAGEPHAFLTCTRDPRLLAAFNDTDGQPLVEKIMDKAGQKGTGKWTAINSLDMGMPVTLIGESGTETSSPSFTCYSPKS
jgi:6-phosphogluconate dehydrogenase